ncbi:hypothetical protein D0Z07_7528 [Hyphodiscus hymeniophilus]|uniref:Telomeric single stranded DNA binding POT1/Cdc13 domain-containing protein n=1 Tax=Hyphodiscus hymeniophilus TaxID=353542 RepID=A0A9P7AU86_9HELO|nr:hypothetical protein D0Z07_7528 [Hyphodiscus hymeniophilus]
MAEAESEMANGATTLKSTSHIPIAQLTPFLAAPSTRSVKAIVTLTWPYSSATGSVAFLLAEPDFRLRRIRGQVRAQFSGSSAKAVANSGIASGDEVCLSLDGVEWIQDEVPFATPGRGIEFDLKFTERLLLEFRREDSQDTNLIDIDHPTHATEASETERIPSPNVESTPYATANSTNVSTPTSPLINNGEEWSSPAFIKRARTSYGSLYDKEYDIFAEEDGTVRGKGRKRSRLSSRLSSTWRYESRSPSPEVEQEHTVDTSPEPEPQMKPVMADEGSQTVGLEEGDAAEVLAGFHKQAMNVGADAYLAPNGAHIMEAQAQVPVGARHDQRVELSSIQTQLGSDDAAISQQDAQYAIPALDIPSSPRLQPVPSHALPLVSPLITNKFGAFLGMGPTEGPTFQNPKLSILPEEPAQMDDEVQENLHGVSPVAVHGEVLSNDLKDIHDAPAMDENSNMQNQFQSGGQYGIWQTMKAQQSRSVSPHKVGEPTIEDQEDHSLTQEPQGEFDFQAGEYSIPASGKHHQYPGPEDENYGQLNSALWGPEPERIAYPNLPEDDEGLSNGYITQPSSHPRAAATSRSGSAQSAPVVQTESNDAEELDEENDGLIPVDGLLDEGDYERSDIEEDVDVENEQNRGRLGSYRSFEEEPSEDEGDPIDVEPVEDRRLRDGSRIDDEDASQYSQGEQEPERESGSEEQEYGSDEDIFYRNQRRFVPEQERERESGSEEQEYGSDEDIFYRNQRRFDPKQEEEFEEFDEEDNEEDNEGSYDEDMEDHVQNVQREPVVIDLLSSDEEDDAEPAVPNTKTATSLRPVDVECPESSEQESSESDEDMEAVEIGQDPVPESRNRPMQYANDSNEGSEEDGHFDTEEDDGVDAVEIADRDDQLPEVENADAYENSMDDAPAYDDNGIKNPHTLSQDAEIIAVDEGLDDDKSNEIAEAEERDNILVNENDEDVVEDFESENPQKTMPYEKHVLQEVDENRDARNMDEKHSDPGSPEINKFSGQLHVEERPQPPPLYSMDGANDERPPSLYPRLPTEEIAQGSLSELSSQEAPVEAALATHANGQLPTPADTQLSLVKETSEVSISLVTVQTQLLQSTSDQLAITSTEEADSQPSNADGTTAVDDTVVHVETEADGSDAVDEDTVIISHEENNSANGTAMIEAQVVVEAHNTRSRARQQNSLEPVLHEEVRTVEEDNHVTPRRSHRRGKSSSSTTETPQPKPPTTPSSASKVRQDEPVSARTDRTDQSSMVLDEKTTPKGQDASIQLAMAALDSPTKQPHDLRSNQPSMDMKLKLTRALRTELSEFTSLKVLKFKLTQNLDVLGIVTTVPPEPERAKSGPRHYQITFNITDHSIAPGGPHVIEVQVFRPYKDALPVVKVGDGILLRDFQVISVKKSGFGLRSIETSSWAVFGDDDEEVVDISGPPVEYGHGERKQMGLLRSWYRELDSAAKEKINRANGEKRTAGAGKSISKVV